MNKEYHVTVQGLVQGVCFRALVQKRARNYGLCGYVKNLPDGSVLLCIQGSSATIELFLTNLKEDSGLARIDTMTTSMEEAKKCFSSFEILR